jgi:hypothetical protein
MTALDFSAVDRKNHTWSYQKFADTNGIKYTNAVPNELELGAIFLSTNINYTSNYFQIRQNNYNYSIFDFSYTTSNTKNLILESFLILAIPTFKKFPNIYLQNIGTSVLDENIFTKNKQLTINVDLEYEKLHKIYVQQGYEIEALELLDYSMVEALTKYVPNFDIEFIDSYIFIYLRDTLQKDLDFPTRFQKAYTVGVDLSPIIQNITKDFSFTPNSNEKRLQKKDYFMITIILLLIYIVLVTYFHFYGSELLIHIFYGIV